MAGVEQHVVDLLLRRTSGQRLDVRGHQRPVLIGERRRDNGNLVATLEVLETGRLDEREVHFLRIEHMKQDDVVAAEAK